MARPHDYFRPGWSAAVDRSASALGIGVADLVPGTVITVITCDHRYLFTLVDPARLAVTVRSDDPRMSADMPGYILGSALVPDGAMRGGWIAAGYGLVFGSESFPFLPSYVELPVAERLYVNGTPIVPAERGTLH